LPAHQLRNAKCYRTRKLSIFPMGYADSQSCSVFSFQFVYTNPCQSSVNHFPMGTSHE